MPFSFMACGYSTSLTIERRHNESGTGSGSTVRAGVWPRGPMPCYSDGSIGTDSTDGDSGSVSGKDRAGSAIPPPTPLPMESWVDTEDRWEINLEMQRVTALVAQLKSLLRREPSLAAPARLREVGLVLSPAFFEDNDSAAATASTRPIGGEALYVPPPSPPPPLLSQPPLMSIPRTTTDADLRMGDAICANNRIAKVDPNVLSIWVNALRRLPGSGAKLRLDNQFSDGMLNVRAEAAARGLAPAQIRAQRAETYEGYMRSLEEDCRMFVDTLTYSGHTVGLDALYMGVPLVTVPGGKIANRVGASLMAASGQGMFIDPSLKAYEDSAVELWRSGGRRRVPRQNPLFDYNSWASNFSSVISGLV